jgi:hexokinase
MIASAYSDPETIIGAIFGTGCNASYMENCGSIAKLHGLPENMPMAINCEYGAFDNDRRVLPRTSYDKKIDKESPRPGEQTFEKMSAGMYLGEILRQVLVDFHKRGLILQGQDTSKLYEPYIITTAFLTGLEDDFTPKLQRTRDNVKQLLNITLTEPERILCRHASELIATRGARLCTCGISAICRKKGITSGHVAADRLVVKNPRFKSRWAQAMGEIFDWPKNRKQDPIIMTLAADGSGLGAAVISAMTLQRVVRGDTTGLRPE